MSREQRLSAVLSQFARTLVTDFPILGILDHLVERIVDVLPVSGAGVTLIDSGLRPHYVSASSEAALSFEKLQTALGEGPVFAAFESGQAVSLPDLRIDARFPRFNAAALEAGFGAVFAFPLRQENGQLGALDLYCDAPVPLDPQDMAAAQTLADVAAAYLLNAQSRQDAIDAADRFRESSLHDALTGLPNRLLLQQRLDHAALRAHRSHANAAVLFADLDGFKKINDTYGHRVGDAMLVAVAGRLSSLVRPGDTLARVSGDEFVILCEDLRSPKDVETLATRIDVAFQAPFALVGDENRSIEVGVTASVGIAFAGRAEEIGHQLVQNADIAMYQAKRKGGAAHQVVDLLEASRTCERIELRQDLRAAFGHHDLTLAYQPIVRTSDGLVVGVEALLRWEHPERGPISPLTMVALAEQDSMILEIGAWVLRRSCEDRIGWLRDYPDRPVDIAVNVSARQLMSFGFRDSVAEILDMTGTDPASLTLEVTEGIFLDDAEKAGVVLSDLKGLGLRLALDDFGTGYSSLGYLRRFPVDIVKIDQGFIAEIGQTLSGSTIIAAVTNLTHALGLSVTAEGVETTEQRDELIAIGCDCAQGYHYGWPTTADKLEELLMRPPVGPLHLPEITVPSPRPAIPAERARQAGRLAVARRRDTGLPIGPRATLRGR